MSTTTTSPVAPPPSIRSYDVAARSTDIFGRVMCSARNHHFVVDGPVQNDCPGEALTPAEVFLSGVSACGVELMHVIARDEGLPLDRVEVTIHGVVDRGQQPTDARTVFSEVHVTAVLFGTTPQAAEALVGGFQRRCPLFGTVAAGAQRVVVRHEVR
jgi:uncharacterized OsmC-like protein